MLRLKETFHCTTSIIWSFVCFFHFYCKKSNSYDPMLEDELRKYSPKPVQLSSDFFHKVKVQSLLSNKHLTVTYSYSTNIYS